MVSRAATDQVQNPETHTEVEIDHDVPGGLAVVDGTAETEDLTGKHPPDAADGVATLVVGGDSNINVVGGRVSVAEGNDGDVDVGSLLDGLGIGAGVGNHDQAGLLERAGDVVGERTGGEATGDGLGTSVAGELQDGTLAVGASGDDANIRRVVDGGDDAGSQDNLLPKSPQSQPLHFPKTSNRPATFESQLKMSVQPRSPHTRSCRC